MIDERARRSSSESTQDDAVSPVGETKSPTGSIRSETKSPTGPIPSGIASPTLGAVVRTLQNLLNDQFDRISDQRGLQGAERVEVTNRYAGGVHRQLQNLLGYDVVLDANGPSIMSLRGGGKDPETPPKTSRKRKASVERTPEQKRVDEEKERWLDEQKMERKVSQMARSGSPAEHARVAGQATDRDDRK